MILIDGHNVFFALDRDRSHQFEKDLNKWREECLSKCDRKGKRFILVLDGSGGRSPHGSSQPSGQHGKVVYSGSVTADEWIDRWIYANPSEMVDLVTGDRRLYEKVKTKRVKLIDPLAWWRSISSPPKNKAHSKAPAPQKKGFGTTEEWMDFFGENE